VSETKETITNEQAKAFAECKLECEECKAKPVCFDFTNQETCCKLASNLLDAREQRDALLAVMEEVFQAHDDCIHVEVMDFSWIEKARELVANIRGM
jgi:hypothetical protein